MFGEDDYYEKDSLYEHFIGSWGTYSPDEVSNSFENTYRTIAEMLGIEITLFKEKG